MRTQVKSNSFLPAGAEFEELQNWGFVGYGVLLHWRVR